MTIDAGRQHGAGLAPDLAALRRYFWLPIASLAIAVAAALVIGAASSPSDEARFRANVVVDALPPLFGPAVLPGPFDYAGLATGDAVVQEVARQSGVAAEQLRPRLTAAARFNTPEIDFKVTGTNALAVARTWQRVFTDAAAQQTPAIERELVQPYARQLDQASAQLQQRAPAAKASPDDPVAQQQLKAAEENYETASKLAQSYDVVATTMKAQAFTLVAPHTQSSGVGSTAGRLGAAVAIGLLAGVIGALLLDYAMRRRACAAGSVDAAPSALQREAERRTGSPTR
ncbi:MAG: hypothetical protein ACHQO8_02810 [Vicinamibacterales bacterium]